MTRNRRLVKGKENRENHRHEDGSSATVISMNEQRPKDVFSTPEQVIVKDEEYTNELYPCYLPGEKYKGLDPDIEMLLKESEGIIKALKIDTPHFTTTSIQADTTWGYSYVKEKHTELERSIAIIDIYKIKRFCGIDEKRSKKMGIGFVAHELRHIWQGQYDFKLYESAFDNVKFEDIEEIPAEIDADAFALYWLSKEYGGEPSKYMEFVYTGNAEGEIARIEAAKKIKEPFQKQNG